MRAPVDSSTGYPPPRLRQRVPAALRAAVTPAVAGPALRGHTALAALASLRTPGSTVAVTGTNPRLGASSLVAYCGAIADGIRPDSAALVDLAPNPTLTLSSPPHSRLTLRDFADALRARRPPVGADAGPPVVRPQAGDQYHDVTDILAWTKMRHGLVLVDTPVDMLPGLLQRHGLIDHTVVLMPAMSEPGALDLMTRVGAPPSPAATGVLVSRRDGGSRPGRRANPVLRSMPFDSSFGIDRPGGGGTFEELQRRTKLLLFDLVARMIPAGRD